MSINHLLNFADKLVNDERTGLPLSQRVTTQISHKQNLRKRRPVIRDTYMTSIMRRDMAKSSQVASNVLVR